MEERVGLAFDGAVSLTPSSHQSLSQEILEPEIEKTVHSLPEAGE